MSCRHSQPEPIAIVGSSCRFAGGATSPSKLWSLLSNPKDLSKEVPSNRFNVKGFYHPDGEYHGTTNSPKAYWLEQDHRIFDASFFNITPKEAEAIDPQQRMLLEVVYEALESAGYTLQQYAGNNVSVFAGVMTADYDTLSQRDDLTASQYYATGNARSILSNRVSYFFNFQGPSMTIDTACSSSLVALHQAVLSLRSQESVMACVAGANLMITPEQFIVESDLHMLSPTGHCRMWDAGADGYARGEGVAVLFVKTLNRALADGDRIEAVIRETGVNSDGRTKGITMPSPEAQASLIRDTYRRAGLNPRDPSERCQYFEAHGTGTLAGDPREAAAIDEAFFGDDRRDPIADRQHSESGKLFVGSVKTVIGHTEGAAGLAGILKVVQGMKNGAVPPNLHFQTLNPSVAPFYSCLRIPTTLMPWPSLPPDRPLRASVNSFGFGGTNAHAIVERYEPSIHNPAFRLQGPQQRLEAAPQSAGIIGTRIKLPLLFSSHSQRSLLANVRTYREWLAQCPSIAVELVAWHLYACRTAHPYRLAVTASSVPEVIQALDDLIESTSNSQSPALGMRSQPHHGPIRILGVFTGQGAQWATMSKDLFCLSDVYRRSIRTLDAILKGLPQPPDWFLEEQILADPDMSSVNIASVSQPLCTALQIALVDLLSNLGVSFDCVIGHSSGEIAAAYAAGRLTARDALLISYYRGLYTSLTSGEGGVKGCMLAAGISRTDATELCNQEEYRGRICVAAHNAPSSVTISGDADAVHRVRDELSKRGKFAKLLTVDTAYHSPRMEKPAAEYMRALATCEISPLEQGNGAAWISTLYGKVAEIDTRELVSAYWRDNMIEPVLFYEAVEEALHEFQPFDCAIEVGPQPVLKGPTIQTMKATTGKEIPYSSLLRRSRDDGLAVSDFLAFMWTSFGPDAVNIRSFVEKSSQPELPWCQLDNMPSYQWDHSQVYYRESRISRQYHFRTHGPHELLGVRTHDDNDFELRWRNILKLEKVPWIEGHKFQGQALLPASAYCVMAFDAAQVVLGDRSASLIELQHLHFLSGITLEHGTQGVELLFSLSILPPPQERQPHSTIEATFTLTSTAVTSDGTASMRKNFEGRLRIVLGDPSRDALPPRQISRAETLAVDPEAFYSMMSGIGLDYSGPFKAIEAMDRRYNFSSATLKRFHGEDTTTLGTSPARLDACLQSAYATFASPGDNALWTSFLPRTISTMRFNVALSNERPPDAAMHVDTHLTDVQNITSASATTISTDVCIFNSSGEMEIQVEGLVVASFAATRPENDYELYLHTVMDVDPEDEILTASEDTAAESDPFLVESCHRVASFYLPHGLEPSSPSPIISPPLLGLQEHTSIAISKHQWQRDTEDSLERFVKTSPYFSTLDFIRTLGKNLPDALPGMLPAVVHEGQQLHFFQTHLSRVVQQISHRYPRMRVLGMTDPEFGVTEYVLEGLKNAFISYTVGFDSEKNLWDRLPQSEAMRRKISTENLNTKEGMDSHLALTPPYDMLILSVSLMQGQSTLVALKNVRHMMKPGGFLLLINSSISSLKQRLERCTGPRGSRPGILLTPPDWPDVLDTCDFVRCARNSDQYLSSGLSLIVRQAGSSEKQHIHQPLNHIPDSGVTDHLLMLGGKSGSIGALSARIAQELSRTCRAVSLARSLDDVDAALAASCTSIIILADLDEPVLSSLTEERLETLKSLFRPEMVILWVTLNARDRSPDQAASFGFSRTILAETPGLVLQMLDLDTLKGCSQTVAEAFARLALTDVAIKSKEGDLLWSVEPEIHVEDGRRLVPRVLPWKPGNDRVNTPRRIVSSTVNSLKSCIEITSSKSREGSMEYSARLNDALLASEDSGQVHLQVHYSSVEMIKIACTYQFHVCIGHDVNDKHGDNIFVALSQSNASFAKVPLGAAYPVSSTNLDLEVFSSVLLRYLVSLTLVDSVKEMNIVLVEPDELLVECAREVMSGRGSTVKVCCTTRRADMKDKDRTTFFHPLATAREMTSIFSKDGAAVFDFLPQGADLSKKIMDFLPENCQYHSRSSMLIPGQPAALRNVYMNRDLLGPAIRMALAKTHSIRSRPWSAQTISAAGLLQAHEPMAPFKLLDWRADRSIPCVVKPLIEENLLNSQKTYVLIGMTRDFGQSICTLFIKHGARNIVVASRNPDMHPVWKDELCAQGADVRIERLDVTNLDDVMTFKDRLVESMPPVAGVVNGAMVLDDRVFSQMDLETFNRVMRPKTVGSKNLDVTFDSPDMEFFIMTSSFAAIGGHAGQSNYASANMYMNGLAANRRKRGLAGSVLNIGVIYGVGLLARERHDIYGGLEREGYPPISERDIHHMFLEAIVAGRPVSGQTMDITTGLRRFRVDDPNPLHWHRDPRFSHYTVPGEDADNTTGDSSSGSAQKRSVKEMIEEAQTVEDVAAVLLPCFARRLEELLHLPTDNVDGRYSIAELGIDSLVAVEVRSWIYKTVGRDVPVLKILGSASIERLCQDIAEQLISEREGLRTAGDGAKQPEVARSRSGSTTDEERDGLSALISSAVSEVAPL